MSSMASEIRGRIQESHDRIEQTAYAIALVQGRLTPRAYAYSLAQLYRIHESLEKSIAAGPAQAFMSREMIRTTAIDRDLTSLGLTVSEFLPLGTTIEITETIFRTADETPLALVGPLYILEGSRMGSRVLVKSVAGILGREAHPGNGVDYHLEENTGQPIRLQQLKQQMENELSDGSVRELVISAAVEFMDDLLDLYEQFPVQLETEGPRSVDARARPVNRVKSHVNT